MFAAGVSILAYNEGWKFGLGSTANNLTIVLITLCSTQSSLIDDVIGDEGWCHGRDLRSREVVRAGVMKPERQALVILSAKGLSHRPPLHRPPTNGGPSFRFNPVEVGEMEAILQAHNYQVPSREILEALAHRFSTSTDRAGKVEVSSKQVWNWFQNRRYALRAKAAKASVPEPGTVVPVHDQTTVRTLHQAPTQPQTPIQFRPPISQAPQPQLVPSTQNAGRIASENAQMEFEAKSARDGAWYDVASFLSHRSVETGHPDALVRFAGFGPEEDEWVNIRKHVRQRSLPCESSECVAVLPGDLILCFQEGKEQALYFDAHVLDAQRRRHDVRGCRCRFLVRYDHDQSEEIVPLRKICRRPETDYRLHQLHAMSVNVNSQKVVIDGQKVGNTLKVEAAGGPTPQKQLKPEERIETGPKAATAQTTPTNAPVASEPNKPPMVEIVDAENETPVENTNVSQPDVMHVTDTVVPNPTMQQG
ncbi:Protein SAWADEE HOMEODOMAIN HOMOLOG 2 [Striga hermonthica]|uniref:Protein SAWADEE HOMEODOMAIN HOMOLOG 2 n=1 Tax=Striga hermonthica TaxID=68872 RepID=A0A9N7R8A6_STRHE|nr:Protein SAWADEE HOMEODOMAIN HOMOLOG 2 [Striga hermonthica]